MDENIEALLKVIRDKCGMDGVQLVESLFSTIMPVLGVKQQVAGAAFISFIKAYDEFKLNNLLLGLSSGVDQEKKINELKIYVTSSKKRAYRVGTLLRQTIDASTPNVSVIYGILLKNHMGDKPRDFSYEEIIICNALKNATDYDLEKFEEIMDKYVSLDSKGERRIDNNEYIYTCEWCLANRIFISNFDTYMEVEGDNINFDSRPRVASAADILLSLIKEAKNLFAIL